MELRWSEVLGWLRRARAGRRRLAVGASPGSSLSSSQADELGRLAEGVSEILGERASGAVGCMLSATSLLDRTWLISSWAVSPREARRLALARAFSHPFDAVSLRTAMEHLASDPSSRVRLAIRRAARLRGDAWIRSGDRAGRSAGLADGMHGTGGGPGAPPPREVEYGRSARRMILVTAELESLRDVVEQARRSRPSPESGRGEAGLGMRSLAALSRCAGGTVDLPADERRAASGQREPGQATVC